MTRVFVDWDADGAFVSISRPGHPAEEVRLSERDLARLMGQVAGAWLAMDHYAGVRKMIDDAPPHFIGHFGE